MSPSDQATAGASAPTVPAVTTPSVPFTTVRSPHRMVASADGLATQAGLALLALGGNAVDAAIATNAAIAVTAPHLCGMGGDLLRPRPRSRASAPAALSAAGRAGSGADAAALRAEGHRGDAVPPRHAHRHRPRLRRRLGGAARAVRPAAPGRRAGPGDRAGRGRLPGLATAGRVPGHGRRRRPRPARRAGRPGPPARSAGSPSGRRAGRCGPSPRTGGRRFYGGRLRRRAAGARTGVLPAEDLAQPQADWVEPLSVDGVGSRPVDDPAQLPGLPGAGRGLDRRGPAPPSRPRRPGLGPPAHRGRHRRPGTTDRACCTKAPTARSWSRPSDSSPRRAAISGESTANRRAKVPTADGDTTYLCAIDDDRHGGVAHPVERLRLRLLAGRADHGHQPPQPRPGLQPRAGHPAELGPGRQPPHTLSPLLVTTPGGELAAIFGTMGGDAQPQILLQLARPPAPPRPAPGGGHRQRALGAARRADRLRHLDRRRGPRRAGRGPRAGGVGRRPRSPAAIA